MYVSDFHTYIKKSMRADECETMTFTYMILSIYMKKYLWDMLYIKKFRGQTLNFI